MKIRQEPKIKNAEILKIKLEISWKVSAFRKADCRGRLASQSGVS